MPELTDAVVIGGGILGAALAYELAQRTLRVTLLETHALASGTTGSGFAWINATAKTDDATYHRLNALSVARYDTMAMEVGADTMGLRGGGSLQWAEGVRAVERERLRQKANLLQQWGSPAIMLSKGEMQALEPKAYFGEGVDAEGLFAPADKWADVNRLTRWFTDAARRFNAVIREYTPAVKFSLSMTGAVTTIQTPEVEIATRLLFLAGGAQTPALAAQVARDPAFAERLALRSAPGLLVETLPGFASGQINRILYPPDTGGLHLRPTPSGGLLIGAEDIDSTLTEQTNSASEREATAILLRRVARFLPALSLEQMETTAVTRLCQRVLPADERPVVGALPDISGVFLAMTHSGVTLAPLLANLLAEEAVTGRVPELLIPYRPERSAIWKRGDIR